MTEEEIMQLLGVINTAWSVYEKKLNNFEIKIEDYTEATNRYQKLRLKLIGMVKEAIYDRRAKECPEFATWWRERKLEEQNS